MNKTKFGAYIKEARINKNYTQQELADLLFVDVSAVSKWERGVSYPDITLIPDICRVLEVSEHELIESSHDAEYRKMKKDANKYNKIKKGTFWALNISYAIALLTCFILNIAVNHTLSWFFIVLSSIICAYSFCPTITWIFNKNRNLVFIGSTFISIFLLFITCSVYTNNYWFMIATLAVLLGYFIVLYPMLFKTIKSKLKGILSRCFLFSYVLGIYVLTNFLLASIYLYVSYNLGMALLITGGVFMVPMAFGILNLFEVSKVLNKPILLSLTGVFLLLIVVITGISLHLKSTEVSKTYNIEQSYNEIKIEGKNLDVNIYLSDSDENKVVYLENKRVSVESKVVDGVLIINQHDNRRWYDMLFNFSEFEVNLYLSKQLIDSLNIDGRTGDVEINQGFTFGSVNITGSTGNIEFKSNIINNFNIKNSTGDVEIKNSNIGGNLNVETSTGDIELVNAKCNKLDIKIGTGETKLENVLVAEDFNMNGSTGDLVFEGFDARNIYVTLTTGDVKGTILSSKIFNATSKTGSVEVPETYTGGICKIMVSTGSINIRYK